MWFIFRIARTAGRQQGAPREWRPFTKLVWLVFGFAIPVAIGGAARVIALCILGAIAAMVLFGVAYGIAHRNDPAPHRDLIAEYFANQEGGKG